MLLPDYSRSIINLMASIGRPLGLATGHYHPLNALTGENFNDVPVVLWIIDGLGNDYLERHPDSFLYHHRLATLSSVFPSTTASAITSFYTGAGPQQHAITGWFTWFRELGCVATVLPFTPRFRGAGFAQADITPQQLIGQPSMLNGAEVEAHVVNPAYISDSVYSLAMCGTAQRHGHTDLETMLQEINRLIADGKRKLVIAYWAEFDGLAHINGIDSDAVATHFAELDRCAQRLADSCRQHNATLLVTADHGLIDTDAAHTIHLDAHPELRDCLTLPLCGEPRAAFCYVHATQHERFERYIEANLSHACELHDSQHLIEQGLFGVGTAHPELRHRIGDYALLMKGNYVIKDRIVNERPFAQIGVHGGLSEAEMRVPLIAIGN